MRRDVSFVSKGQHCRGWLYLPDRISDSDKVPTIIMAHGFSGVKEQALPEVAERFAQAGFGVLLFDYRYFGSSDGEPRCQLFPLEMVEDYRNALTYASLDPNVNNARLAVWGTSFSGGLATYTGLVDRRVKAVVAQVPGIQNADTRSSLNPETWERVGKMLIDDRDARYRTGVVNYLKVVAPEGEPCALPGTESYDAFMALEKLAPTWRNEITLESLEKIREFDPLSLIHRLHPTPLLIIAAEHDTIIPLELNKLAYEKASEPKKLIVHPIKHFDVYQEPWLTTVTDEAIDWFNEHLKG